MEQKTNKDIRCPVCMLESESAKMPKGKYNCPSCHTSLVPLVIAWDTMIVLNWQDLRVLAIYAKRWASFFDISKPLDQDCLKALNRIIEKIQERQPKGALPAFVENEVITHVKINGAATAPKKPEAAHVEIHNGHEGVVSPYFGNFGPPGIGQ